VKGGDEVKEFLLVLLGLVIGFGIRPWYVLLTGRDIPCVNDDEEGVTK